MSFLHRRVARRLVVGERLAQPGLRPRARGLEMENAVVLREWFDRVDAGRTGNITAPQLQVRLPSAL